MWIDKGKQLSIQSVSSPQWDRQFKPSDVDVPNLGTINAAVWARFTIYNPKHAQQKYLSFDFPVADDVILFIPHESGFDRLEAGHAVEASERLIPSRHLRNQHPLSLLLFDIDDFKAFNDTYVIFKGMPA